jgi:hypothetical protein
MHLDEGKPTAPAGFPIGNDLGSQHGPELRKRLYQVFAGSFERNVPNVQLLAHNHPHKLAYLARSNEYRRRTSASAVQEQTRFFRYRPDAVVFPSRDGN